jgi:hypothetical protein
MPLMNVTMPPFRSGYWSTPILCGRMMLLHCSWIYFQSLHTHFRHMICCSVGHLVWGTQIQCIIFSPISNLWIEHGPTRIPNGHAMTYFLCDKCTISRLHTSHTSILPNFCTLPPCSGARLHWTGSSAQCKRDYMRTIQLQSTRLTWGWKGEQQN